ncbi:hypothetical protein A5647_20260 [Mycobacterium sp. 1100029.7]|nr:hypothetical protein A5647_20260 [Mycobacterium sp. 1100029.7]
MYCGAGSGPMVAAAAAWHTIAAQLRCTAAGYSSVLAELSGHWHGPTWTAMIAAVAPYVVWLNATSAHAEHTAAMAEMAVAAYEAAFAATVPPAVVAANRVRLMMLVATNFLGQHTPAIAATEAEYAEMWAQDAAAMHGYAAASSAIELVPFGAAWQTTRPTGVAGGWNPFAPGSASDTTGLNGLLNAIFGPDTAFGQVVNSNILNTIFMPAFYMPSKYLGNSAGLLSLGQKATPSAPAGAAGTSAVQPSSVSAAMGRGTPVGPLSVPPSWASNAPAAGPAVPASAKGPAALPAAPAGNAPGMPLAGRAGGHTDGRAIPQYGFKPTFVVRPPAAG